MRIYANEKRFSAASDAQSIQNAIDFAAANCIPTVVIPQATSDGRTIREIEKCILLPLDITVIPESCHLRMADGVRENMFRNRNARTAPGNTLAGEQRNIRLIGEGDPVPDGGLPNGLCEQLHRDDPNHYPCMYVNLTVFLHNVCGFEVRNIHFKACRYRATCFMFCRNGSIAACTFPCTEYS